MTHIRNLTKRMQQEKLFLKNYFVPQNVHSIFTMKIKKKKTSVFLNYVKVVESVLRTVQFGEKDRLYTLLGNKGFQKNYILK